MVEVKIERRSSGRLVRKRIILSDDEENNENVVDVKNGNRSKRKSIGTGSSEEDFIPANSSRTKVAVSDESETESSSCNEVADSKRSRREKVEELRERRSNRTRRMRESEKLISDLSEIEIGESRRTRSSKAKMEEEDAALAAAISAGYFSDEEREMEHVRLRRETRFKNDLNHPTSTNTTPTYNPYARNGLGSYSGPMRRSGRTAAVVSAARVAMYSSMLNPDSSLNLEDAAPAPKYNLRPNRPGGHDDSAASAIAAAAAYYDFNNESTSRLYEEEDVDGHQVVNNEDGNGGEVSLEALDKIAGMDGYVRKLKEMIVFPLIYPHLFSKLNISLPRGVLFHGPPGTGKTLMARLLAAACSTSTRKVSFFMRNGSDCLSKWIGEAERNMRLLFKKAKECQPAIIFFDEIDGLAPERTGRQDQSHISLVSTLLALMDGLDDRGQVVVIGATNRIHSIDAALRRPGRFDREFFFGLPDESARAQILKIHTKTWDPPIEDELARDLASRTSGYSGADMKALCVEAALRAVQRTFPEVYESASKIEIENSENGVKIVAADFEHALINLTPSNRRHVSQYDLVSLQKPQSILYDLQVTELKQSIIDPRLKRNLTMDASGKVTWQLLEPLVIKVQYDSLIHPESFVWRFICGIGDGLDGFLVHPVDLINLRDDASGLEAALWRGLNDARLKGGAFCVLFKSFSSLSREERKSFVSVMKRFTNSLIPGEPVILIYTKQQSKTLIKSENQLIKQFNLAAPNSEQLKEYFNFILRSLHRILSSEKSLNVTEIEFLESFDLTRFANKTVLQLEQIRMEMSDQIRNDPMTFEQKYFTKKIFRVSAKESQNDNVVEADNDKFKESDNDKLDVESDDYSFKVSDNEIGEAPEDLLFK